MNWYLCPVCSRDMVALVTQSSKYGLKSVEPYNIVRGDGLPIGNPDSPVCNQYFCSTRCYELYRLNPLVYEPTKGEGPLFETSKV